MTESQGEAAIQRLADVDRRHPLCLESAVERLVHNDRLRPERRRIFHMTDEHRQNVEDLLSSGLKALADGNAQEARGLIDKALVLDSTRVDSLLATSLACWMAGDLEAAKDAVKAASCYISDDIGELVMVGLAYARGGNDTSTAYHYLMRALSLAEGDAELTSVLADALLEIGFPDESRDAAERALSIQPELAEASLTLGSAYIALDNYEDAIEHLIRATHGIPDNAVPPFLLGVALYETGQWADAARAFGEAAKREPDDHMIDVWRAKALYETGQTDAAISIIDNLLEEAQEDADLAVEIGNFYGLNAEMPSKAIPLLEKAIKLDPTLSEAYFNLIYAYLLTGNETQARKTLMRLSEIDIELAQLAIENLMSITDEIY
ncbi:MAG TPA: tetratricopeptide repeat protein [Bacillota bacterium]|nr:tetratricopeptide repeat protein [Bacillota bacterium]